MTSKIPEIIDVPWVKIGLSMILFSIIFVRASSILLGSGYDSIYLPQYAIILFLSSISLIYILRNHLRNALVSALMISLIEFFIGLDKSVSNLINIASFPIPDYLYSFITSLAIISIAIKSRDVLFTKRIRERDLIFDTSREHSYAVELVDVVKDYIVGPYIVHALRGVNMRVKKGDFVAIMGPSGSGKSTLLNMIGAIDRPTSGKVYVDGIDISKLNDNELAELRNKKIGFVFQAYNLINRTTVLRNVELPAIVSGMPGSKRIKRAKELLELVGLKEEIHRSPKYLSGGQQQRVAIARALMNNPSLILADEPTGNLDSKSGEEVMKYLRKLNKDLGTTVIVVTHNRSVAEMADRILYIKDGVIVGEEILRER